jgi:hypothetical protein
MNSQDSPWPGLGGSDHLPPYRYIFCLAMGLAPKCHFVPKIGSPKIPKIKIPSTLGSHNFVCKPLIEVRSEVML